MHRGHHFSYGIKRSFADTRIFRNEFVFRVTYGVGVGNERCFGRFAGNIAVIVNFGVAAQAHGFCQIRTVFGEVEMVNNRHFVLG